MSVRERFIEHLEALAKDEDRGALAGLRRGLGKPPGSVTAMLPHVVPFLPADRPADHPGYFLVASLFALHPESVAEGNMGTAFRQLGDHESAVKRFLAMLDCHVEQLGEHLRHAISLARSKEVPINYRLLLDHLVRWPDPERKVQLAWAREYWAKESDEGDTDRG